MLVLPPGNGVGDPVLQAGEVYELNRARAPTQTQQRIRLIIITPKANPTAITTTMIRTNTLQVTPLDLTLDRLILQYPFFLLRYYIL